MISFHKFLLQLEAGETPPPIPPPDSPTPPSTPDSGMGGADPMAGDSPQTPRKSINVTSVWEVLKDVLKNDNNNIKIRHNQTKPKETKPKSLLQ